MRAMLLRSKLRLPSCLMMVRDRRKAKVDSGQQQHSSCARCVLSRHHGCIEASSSERCSEIANTSRAGGCRKFERELRRSKTGQAAAARSTRDAAWRSCGWRGRKAEGCNGPLRPRANLVLFSQEFENDGPVSGDNFRGRYDQSLAVPGVGGDAGGG
jgi:hypothetical protein